MNGPAHWVFLFPLFPVWSQNPGMPHEEGRASSLVFAVSSLEKEGGTGLIKGTRGRGKVISFPVQPFFGWGFLTLPPLCTFIKLIIILTRASQVRANGAFVRCSISLSGEERGVTLTSGLFLHQCAIEACLVLLHGHRVDGPRQLSSTELFF